MGDAFTFDVFLSHNQHDKPRVRELAKQLREAGLRVWLDEWVIKAGDIIALKVEKGLEQSRTLVLCLSAHALTSDWVKQERSAAIHRDPANTGRRFIPLLLSNCNLPDSLRRYRYIDYRQASAAAMEELIAACRAEYKPNAQASESDVEAIESAAAVPAKTRAAKPKPKKKPVERKLKPAEPPQQAEPLAVLERKLTGHRTWVNCVVFSRDGTWAASAGGHVGGSDMTVKTWDLETGQCLATLEGHTDQVKAVQITPDGKRIVSGSFDKSVRIWDARSGQELAKLQGHTGEVWSVIALQDNARALSGGFDKTLRLWDLSARSCLMTIECGTRLADNVFSCAVNQSGTKALSGHLDGRIRLWDLETRECLMVMKGHSNVVKSIQITLDGMFAVSGSQDQTVKIWDLETGICIGTLEGHLDGAELRVAISSDGDLIASTGFSDSTVRLWDRKSGVCLEVLEREPYWAPMAIAFDQFDSRLIVGTANSPIYVYCLSGVRAASAAEATRRYVNAKVVLLGEGTVGKTSLAHRLIEDRYVVKDRTHGMNVWRLVLPEGRGSLPEPTQQSATGGDATSLVRGANHDNLDREALLWDLAGQEDYRLIHRLFLDETALALLLINPQKDDPFAEAGDWLKALDTATTIHDSKRNVERLLIFSQIDVGGMKLGSNKIDRFVEQQGFADWLATSAKTGENCSDKENGGQPSKLKQLIADSIPWDRLPWTATPRLLAELKNSVMAMREKTDIRLLRFSELEQRLEQTLPDERFKQSDVRTAVTLLANHGLARPLKFGDLVLLQPELLNGYAGAIIRSARAHVDEIGCVLEADIYGEGFDFTGVDRLPRADEELLLRAMVQTFLDHSLCIAEETTQGRQLVFPSQYRREKDIPHEPDIFVSYTFHGEWQTVWTTLVVRLWYSQEFEHRELWRNAAEFESNKGHTLGIKIQNRQGEGEATISLYFEVKVPDELKVTFIEYLHRHLARYACDVTRDRRYVCQCGKPVLDHDEVRTRLVDGKTFIYCQKCDEKVELIDHIEQRLKSDPVARKILQMEETANRELDTQALEQILIGHMMAICGEANQIFRPTTMFDNGIDGEVEFKDNDGRASGKRIYVQLKSGNSYLRTRRSDGREVFDAKNDRHLEYWINQPVDVFLVIRQSDERSSDETIRWMNVTRYLKKRKDKQSRQIIFDGEKLNATAIWKTRDQFFPPT